jgi:epoxyqueuosine reductase QueG
MQARDEERARPQLDTLARLGSNQRKRYLQGRAMRRTGRDAMLRNIAVALGNIQGPAAQQARPAAQQASTSRTLDMLSKDRSSMVREHAQWALDKSVKDD